MKLTDVVGYVIDGACYCVDCADDPGEDGSAMFPGDECDSVLHCDTCGEAIECALTDYGVREELKRLGSLLLRATRSKTLWEMERDVSLAEALAQQLDWAGASVSINRDARAFRTRS